MFGEPPLAETTSRMERPNAKLRRVPKVTLRDVAATGMRLRVVCSACLHWSVVVPRPLLDRHGETLLPALPFRSRCCGARGVPRVTSM